MLSFRALQEALQALQKHPLAPEDLASGCPDDLCSSDRRYRRALFVFRPVTKLPTFGEPSVSTDPPGSNT